jgi:DNA-binding NarL/FixJ family response regulator
MTGAGEQADTMALRLLIVDDNLRFLEVARTLLEQEGAEVVGAAQSSEQALLLAQELQPDVVLVDIALGTESGFDLACRMQHESKLRVVLISSYREVEFADLIAASPAIGFVSKSDLSTSVIHDLLDNATGR